MAVSRALRRLLQIREIEEEQSRLALDAAAGELHRLERLLAAARERERQGRRLVVLSARTGQLPDRLAGLEETRAAGRHGAALAPRIEAGEEQVTELREEFLLKRVGRRQAETLIRETEALQAIEAGRRSQQSLDDWYRSGQRRQEAEPERNRRAEAGLPKAAQAARHARPGSAGDDRN